MNHLDGVRVWLSSVMLWCWVAVVGRGWRSGSTTGGTNTCCWRDALHYALLQLILKKLKMSPNTMNLLTSSDSHKLIEKKISVNTLSAACATSGHYCYCHGATEPHMVYFQYFFLWKKNLFLSYLTMIT